MIDVARKAGVSQATVSRVVNGDPNVMESTRQAVTKAMQALGYAPKQKRKRFRDSGPSAQGGGHGTIALLLLDDSMSSHPAMALAKLRGVETAVKRAGMTLTVTAVHEDEPLAPALSRTDLCGVLLWGASIRPALAGKIESLPRIWLTSHVASGSSAVLIGNEQAGKMAAEYLMDKGVRRPAVLCLPTSEPQYELRIRGFRYACHVRDKESLVITTGARPPSSFSAMPRDKQQQIARQLIKKISQTSPRPDGLFIPDDSQTALIYPMLVECGILPEKDILIVSCDNESAYLNALHPRPATIDLRPEATGRLATEQLIHLATCGEPEDQVSVLITPCLVPPET